MTSANSELDPQRQRLAEIAEKYGAHIALMSDRELLDDLERKALMASYGILDPTTAMMLKASKAEILRRMKGGESQKTAQSDSPAAAEPSRPTLFG